MNLKLKCSGLARWQDGYTRLQVGATLCVLARVSSGARFKKACAESALYKIPITGTESRFSSLSPNFFCKSKANSAAWNKLRYALLLEMLTTVCIFVTAFL